MRLTTLFALTLAVVLSPPLMGQSIRPGGPTDGGTRAVCDLPTSQHIRNVGGSDGAGLCVFTSAEHTSRWQSCVLAGFQQWMRSKPGGGYPEKLEEMIVRFCRENKRDIPRYIQHTGGDETVLDLAIKTGRMPCITYAGQDDFYQGETIAHMVNLVHLDQEKAAILDNNRPGQIVWMTRKQLLDRWRGVDASGRSLMIRAGVRMVPVGGGWCVIFLDGPPPPYGIKPENTAKMTGGPNAVPLADVVRELGEGRVMFGQCPGGVCPTPTRWGTPSVAGPVTQPYSPLYQPLEVKTPDEYNRAIAYVLEHRQAVLVVGKAPSWFKEDEQRAKVFSVPSFGTTADGVYSCWKEGEVTMWQLLPPHTVFGDAPKGGVKPDPAKVEPKVVSKPPEEPESKNFGVDTSKLTPGKWFHNGAEVSKGEALAAVAGDALADDSERWFLICVGTAADQAKFSAAVKSLEPSIADKLHVKAYTPSDWQVSQFALPVGVSVRKPAKGRVGEEAGRLTGELTPDTLKRFVADGLNPPKPMPPAPTPTPTPDQPSEPQPQPAPEPTTPNTLFGLPMWVVAAIAAGLTYFLTRRKS